MMKPAPQSRTDTLVCPLNAGILAKVRDLVTVMRKIAEEESDRQWRRFYRGGWQGFESMATKGWSRPSRKHLLQDLVGQFLERHPRPRGGPSDPRLSNPYFKEWPEGVRSAGTASPSPNSCSALV